MAQQPTPEQLQQYVKSMVEAVLAGADIDVAQLPVANGVALQQRANDLTANPTDETITGRLKVALLALGGADALEVMQEALDLARLSPPSQPAVPGGLGGLLSGLGVPNIPPTPQHAFPTDPQTATQPPADPNPTAAAPTQQAPKPGPAAQRPAGFQRGAR